MADLASHVGDVCVFRLGPTVVQITTSGDSIVTYKVPFKCRILKMKAGVEAIGGSTDPTDVDVDLENGTVDIGDPLAAVDSSTIVSGGVEGTPDSGQDDLAAGDIIHMDVDVTGGSSPTVDGVWAELVVVRE
jgi:hypothetical protein